MGRGAGGSDDETRIRFSVKIGSEMESKGKDKKQGGSRAQRETEKSQEGKGEETSKTRK